MNMLSAVCPSCSAPLRFAHASAPVVVCGSCSSTVARSDQDLRLLGKVSKFARDLSPIRVGARGKDGERSFEVVGVLRKGRDRVRWNEWFLVYDEGSTGWLSEGNAQYNLFSSSPIPLPSAPRRLSIGDELAEGERRWKVLEWGQASVLAAEGSLPFAVTDNSALPYADLRSRDGREFATLDYADTPPSLWVGRTVDLPSLKMQGLRRISGWSDGVEGLDGPEIKAVRALRCPNCSGALSLRAPGQTQRVVCEYCGSSLGIDEAGDAATLALLQKAEAKAWKPPLKLGARGKLGGVDWEVLGAMQRVVQVYGVDYPWVEHLLYNPYRGFRWLVESNGHWNFVLPMTQVPATPKARPSTLRLGEDRYRHFQGGLARVRKVLGEFYWEISAGDTADTDDWVSPPRMISREVSDEEVNWSLGQYVPIEEMRAAFGDLPAPRGVNPTMPNPMAGPRIMSLAWLSMALLLGLNLLMCMGAGATSSPQLLVDASWSTLSKAQDEVLLSQPFTLSETSNLKAEIETGLDRANGQVHVALVNTGDAMVYLLGDAEQNEQTVWLRGVPAGTYVARIEVAHPPELIPPSSTVGFKLRSGEPYTSWLWLSAALSLLAPLMVVLGRASFETRRWAESDHAE